MRIKDRHENVLAENDTVVVVTPESASKAVQGKIIAIKPVLNLPPNAPAMVQIAVSVVFNFMVPATASQLSEMWVVKEPGGVVEESVLVALP